ncbi:MAG: sugar ABC transporter ATP-binding protein [Spirochaetales bacterium]|nr:MAG: sugar ABC transporter ATP-binding protein [Spirochaetales bacterium]
MENNILELKNVIKEFPGVLALNKINLEIKRNSVHCLVGENGAGKSTLIKVLTGALPRSSGKILLNGNEFHPHNTKDAREQGISTLFQELNVVDQLTVEQNLTLGREDVSFGFLKKSKKTQGMVEILKSIEPSIDEKQLVSKLSVAKKQLVEIARAIASDAEIIIMDEPTAAISESEINRLFTIIKGLKENNVTVIYISHRLDEIFEIGDYVSVLRDGELIGTKLVSEVKNKEELIKMMIGKEVREHYVPNQGDYSVKVLEVKNLTNGKLKDISFDVYKGEIIGFYGLVGAGKTELGRALYGVDEFEGHLIFNGQEIKPRFPRQAIDYGISMVPEERRTEGLFTLLTIKSNIPVMNLNKIAVSGLKSSALERNIANDYIKKMRVVTTSAEKQVALLSGGNQQKIVFAKCLFADSQLMLLDEPTRGVDVGAKEEIHNLIRQLSREGKSIIVFSSELPEILNLCDRIFLLYEGELKAEMKNGMDIDDEKIIHIVAGSEA